MTKKDFELIAAAIASYQTSKIEKEKLAHHFASMLSYTNTRFDHDRFIAATQRKAQ